MASDEDFVALEGRVTELENRLGVGRERAAVVTREEYDAFAKVHGEIVDRLAVAPVAVCRPCVPGAELERFLGLAPEADPTDEGGAGRFGDLGE